MFKRGQILKCLNTTRSHFKDRLYTFQVYIYENGPAMYTVEGPNIWGGIDHSNFVAATRHEINKFYEDKLVELNKAYSLALKIVNE